MDRPMRLAWKYSWNVFQVCWKMNLFLAVYNFFIFCFVCFFFCFFLCHIFEYFNNFVPKHWLFAFISQNSHLSTWGSCRLGSASIVFFLQTSFDQLYNKIILCAWTCPIFSACHPWYIMCLWRKHDGCFNNGYHRFHNCFVCGILFKLINVSILECQCMNLCVCVCITCEASSQTIAPPSNHKLVTTSCTFSKMWTAMAANNALLQSTFEVTDAPHYTMWSKTELLANIHTPLSRWKRR